MGKRTTHETTKRYEFMQGATRQLGALALDMIQRGITVEIKPDGSKVTTADKALNQLFIELVGQQFPNDLVWGEEASNSEKGNIAEANRHWMWLLDPIDGTGGFWRSYQNHKFDDCTATTLVAGFAPGETSPTISTIHNPFQRQQMTLAANPSGVYYQASAARSPRRIRIAPGGVKELGDVRRFEQNQWSDSTPNLDTMQTHVSNARRIKHQLFMGAVALGDVDISAFPGPSHPHDIAAGAHIVYQAGGAVRSFKNETYQEVDWRVDPIAGVVAAATSELASALVAKYGA